jgi:LacI family transcriptional regulator
LAIGDLKVPTIKDVARKANVSTATVSRVLNNHEWVDAATAERVRETIRAMNYVPSALARGVREQKSGIVGILMDTQGIPVYHDLFFTEIIRGVGGVLEPQGKHLLVYSGMLGSDTHIDFGAITGKLLDGIVIGGTAVRIEQILTEVLKRTSLSVVVIGQHLPGLDVSRVLVDNWLGGYVIGRELVERGARSIAVMTPAGEAYAFRDRVDGLRAALDEWERRDIRLYVQSVEGMDTESGYRSLPTLLEISPRVNAVVITHSALTIGAIRYAQEVCLSIPDDLLLVGDGPSNIIDLYPQSSAFIHTDARRVGELAAGLVLDKLSGEHREHSELVVDRKLYIPERWKDFSFA